MPRHDGVYERRDGVVVSDVARQELVRQAVDGTTGARHDRGALTGEHGADAGADTAHATGHQDDAARQ